jgi:hypothetical protein
MVTFKFNKNSTEVYKGNKLLKKLLPNKSKFTSISENFTIVSKSDKVKNFHYIMKYKIK